MSKVIYKYILNVDDGINEIMLPEGSEVVGCIFQKDINKASIYALHDSKPILCNIEKRLFKIYSTGETINSNIVGYVGAFVIGKLVFHIVEINNNIDNLYIKEKYIDIVEVNRDGTICPSFRLDDKINTSGYLKYFNNKVGNKVKVTLEIIN